MKYTIWEHIKVNNFKFVMEDNMEVRNLFMAGWHRNK
jgi:hypothetical protein